MTELEIYLEGDEWGEPCHRCGWHMTERAGQKVCEVCAGKPKRKRKALKRSHGTKQRAPRKGGR